jgi:hypothetical protein
MTLRKVVIVLSGLLLGLSVAAPANAAHRRATQTTVNWAQRDAAVYVVSTLNLLRTDTGQPVSTVFKSQLHVKRYMIEADASLPDLYYIELVSKGNTVVGTFAYKMGWQKPAAITDFGYISVPRATADIVSAYRTDRHMKVASFTSTLPS